jgi:hypothetical protein
MTSRDGHLPTQRMIKANKIIQSDSGSSGHRQYSRNQVRLLVFVATSRSAVPYRTSRRAKSADRGDHPGSWFYLRLLVKKSSVRRRIFSAPELPGSIICAACPRSRTARRPSGIPSGNKTTVIQRTAATTSSTTATSDRTSPRTPRSKPETRPTTPPSSPDNPRSRPIPPPPSGARNDSGSLPARRRSQTCTAPARPKSRTGDDAPARCRCAGSPAAVPSG